jgi:isoleucyl-tRNA synthetase
MLPVDSFYKTNGIREKTIIKSIYDKLFDNGYVYKDYKILPYSLVGETNLTISESQEQSIDIVRDFIYVLAKLTIDNKQVESNCEKKQVELIVYTTTPYTIFMNAGLCINTSLNYSIFENKIALTDFFIERNINSSLLEPFDIKTIIGSSYLPFFNFAKIKNPIIYDDSFVKSCGSGIVHIDPIHGCDDFELFKKSMNLPFTLNELDIISKDRYTIPELNGLKVTNNTEIINMLYKNNLIYDHIRVKEKTFVCPRTGGMIINKACEEVFLKVDKQKMIDMLNKITFTNEQSKNEMYTWVENSRDWCISRSNRIYGSDFYYDNKKYILDCWFDSACVPYFCKYSKEEILEKRNNLAKVFLEYKDKSTNNIEEIDRFNTVKRLYNYIIEQPYYNNYEIVIEGNEQVRNWFYYLLIVAIGLGYTEPPMKTIMTTGMILDKQYRKISKSKGNSPITVDDEFIKNIDYISNIVYSNNIIMGRDQYIPFDSKSIKTAGSMIINIKNMYTFYNINLKTLENLFPDYICRDTIEYNSNTIDLKPSTEFTIQLNNKLNKYYYKFNNPEKSIKDKHGIFKKYVTFCSKMILHNKCLLASYPQNNDSIEYECDLYNEYLYFLKKMLSILKYIMKPFLYTFSKSIPTAFDTFHISKYDNTIKFEFDDNIDSVLTAVAKEIKEIRITDYESNKYIVVNTDNDEYAKILSKRLMMYVIKNDSINNIFEYKIMDTTKELKEIVELVVHHRRELSQYRKSCGLSIADISDKHIYNIKLEEHIDRQLFTYLFNHIPSYTYIIE